jgi:hypothetical protein
MKKIIFGLIVTIAISSFSYGQAIFEHSYSSDTVNPNRINSFNTESGINYYTINKTLNTISIYNSSHALTKTVNITVPANSNILNIYAITDKLFNSDNLIEFIVSIYSNTDYHYSTTLYNENGVIIQQFGANSEDAHIVKDTNNNYKLITRGGVINPSTSVTSYVFDVYSLPGTLSVNQQSLLSKHIVGYPNPTENDITITNNLENGENAKLEVFDTNGKKVLEKNVVGEDGELNLDVSNLSSGVYIYKLKGETNRFIKK